MANRRSRFFHGYHGHNCYLPLYIFAGERLLWVPAALEHRRLGRQPGRSRADRHPDSGRDDPRCESFCGADSGFCRDALMRQPSPLCSGWRGIRDCVNSLARTRPKRVRYTSKRSPATRVFTRVRGTKPFSARDDRTVFHVEHAWHI
jgi:hypothetical protein